MDTFYELWAIENLDILPSDCLQTSVFFLSVLLPCKRRFDATALDLIGCNA